MASFTQYGIYYYQGDFRIMEIRKELRGPEMKWDLEDKADIIWKSCDLEWLIKFVTTCEKERLDPYIYREQYIPLVSFD